MPEEGRPAVTAAVSQSSGPPARGSMRHTLTLAMVLMAVVPALVGALLLGTGGRALIRAEVFRHMQSIAQGACLDVGHILEARVDATDAFTRRLYVRQAIAVLTSGVADGAMGAAQARALLTAQLADLSMPSGRREGCAVIVSLPGGLPLAWAGQSAAQAAESAAYHKSNLTAGLGKPWVSPAHLDAGDQTPVVCFIEAIPQSLTGTSPRAAALIWSVALAPSIYSALDARKGLGETGEIVLVDRTGLALKDLRDEPNTRFRKIIRTEPVQRALRGDSTVRDSLDYRGKPVVAAAGQVPSVGWGIVAKMDAAEAYAGITRLTRLWAGLMAGLLLLGALAAGALSRHLLRPVEQLSAATQAMAAGEPSAALDTGRTDELGQMARDFDTMAVQVASARSTLEVALAQTRETRDYLDNLLDYANAPIIVWDTNLRITRFNHAFERLTGRSEQSVWGEQISLLLPEAEIEPSLRRIRGATSGEHWDTVEIPVQHVDGSIRTVLWNSAAVYGPDGQTVVAAIAQGQDITDRKAALETLAASEEQHRSLVETMAQGVVYQDKDGFVTSANPAAERVLGLSLAQMQGRTSADPRWRAVDENLAPFPGERHPIMVALRTGQVVTNVLMGVYSPAADELRWLLISAVPQFRSGESVPHGAFAMFTDVTERQAAESALRASEEQYRTLFTNMLNGLASHEIVLDEEGKPVDYRFLEVNDAFEKMLGLKREQVVGRLASDLFPQLQQSWVETYGQVALTGSVARFEEYAEGLDRWFEVQAYSPRHGEFATLFDDITERKQAAETLRQSEERFRSIFNEAAVGIAVTAMDGTHLDCNEALLRIHGLTREQFLSTKAEEYTHPDDRNADPTLWLELLAGQRSSHSREVRYVRPDGGVVNTRLTVSLVAYGSTGELAALTMVEDVTERQRAEREAEERAALEELLRVTERMLAATSTRGLLEQLVEGVRELTESALCTAAYGSYGDDLATEALAYNEAVDPSVAGVALRELRAGVHLKLLEANSPVHLTDAEMASFPGFSLLAAHSPVQAFTGVLLPNTSRETVGMIMASNKADGSDLSVRDEALILQLTALASLALRHLDLNLALSRQTAELEASNRELASFSHSVSHDLRAPLRAVDGFSQALLEDYGSKLDAQALEYLQRLRAATGRMGDLIDDLLQLSRVTRETMRWEKVDLSALATEIAAELDESEPSRAVVWKIEPGLLTTGHPRLLGVLLRNLLGNAFKFTGKTPEATIEFGAEQREGKMVYFAKDNGAGFNMAYADKLFAPFQRLHAMEEFPGNGVGLATVQRVVHRHGGRVWAEAEVGKGATFRFTY